MSEGIPEGWALSTLSEIAHVKGGKRLPKGRPFAPSRTAFPYIRVSDCKKGTVSLDDLRYVYEEDWAQIRRYTISKNDLYISIAGTLGIVGTVPDRLDGSLLTENAAKIVLKNKEAVNKRFLKYYLLSEEPHKHFLQSKGTGGGVPKLALFRIEDTPILLPSSLEQREIASILTSVDAVIEKTEAQISKLQDLKKGMMQELLTKGIGHTEFKDSPVGRIPKDWILVNFFDVISIPNGQVDPKDAPYRDMILIAPNHVEGETGRLLGKETALQQNAISGKYFCKPNTVILSKIRPRLRKAVLVDFECLCSADMYPLNCTDKVVAAFLKHLILDTKFSYFAATVSERSNIPKINRTELAEYRFALPPVDEQEVIADALMALDERIDSGHLKLNAVRSVKKSLMQDLLTGKVRVKVN